MVIYLQLRKVMLFKFLIIIYLIVIVCFGGYAASFFKYNDKKIVDMEVLRTQNRILQNEVDELNKLKSIKGEYVIGRVIVRNIHDFYSEVVIDLGRNDGISVTDGVLNSEGLVGIVSEVYENKSLVRLLSSNYNVSVKINDVYGNLNQGKVTLLDKYSEIKKDDLVYTSGYSGIPYGIYVGRVEEITMDGDNLGKEVKIKLVDNTHLNYVGVIRSDK